MSHLLRFGVALVLTTTFLGCGYSTSRLLPAAYQSIHVAPFKNKIPITEEVSERTPFQSNVPGLAEDVTQGVITQFLFDGNLRVTSDPAQADLLMEGEIYDFYRQALRQFDDDSVEEFRLNLGAKVSLRNKKGEVMWVESSLIGDTTFFAAGSLAVSETAALEDLVTDFSQRVVERVIEDW